MENGFHFIGCWQLHLWILSHILLLRCVSNQSCSYGEEGRVMGLAVDCSLHRLTWTPHDEDQEDIDWIQLDYICENSSVSNLVAVALSTPPALVHELDQQARPAVGQECRYFGCASDILDFTYIFSTVTCTGTINFPPPPSTSNGQFEVVQTTPTVVVAAPLSTSNGRFEVVTTPTAIVTAFTLTEHSDLVVPSESDMVVPTKPSELNVVHPTVSVTRERTTFDSFSQADKVTGTSMVISIVAPILLAVATFVVVLCLVVFCYSFAAQRKRKNTERWKKFYILQSSHTSLNTNDDFFKYTSPGVTSQLMHSSSESSIHTILDHPTYSDRLELKSDASTEILNKSESRTFGIRFISDEKSGRNFFTEIYRDESGYSHGYNDLHDSASSQDEIMLGSEYSDKDRTFTPEDSWSYLLIDSGKVFGPKTEDESMCNNISETPASCQYDNEKNTAEEEDSGLHAAEEEDSGLHAAEEEDSGLHAAEEEDSGLHAAEEEDSGLHAAEEENSGLHAAEEEDSGLHAAEEENSGLHAAEEEDSGFCSLKQPNDT